jgi:hypothetical protein
LFPCVFDGLIALFGNQNHMVDRVLKDLGVHPGLGVLEVVLGPHHDGGTSTTASGSIVLFPMSTGGGGSLSRDGRDLIRPSSRGVYSRARLAGTGEQLARRLSHPRRKVRGRLASSPPPSVLPLLQLRGGGSLDLGRPEQLLG